LVRFVHQGVNENAQNQHQRLIEKNDPFLLEYHLEQERIKG